MTLKANYDLSAVQKICNYAALEASEMISTLNNKSVNIMFTGIDELHRKDFYENCSTGSIVLKIRFRNISNHSLTVLMTKKTFSGLMNMFADNFSADDKTSEIYEIGISALKQIIDKIYSKTYQKIHTETNNESKNSAKVSDIEINEITQSDNSICSELYTSYSYSASFIVNSDNPCGTVTLLIPSNFFVSSKQLITSSDTQDTLQSDRANESKDNLLTDTQYNNLSLLLDVPLELSVEIGSAKYKIEDVLSFTSGSIVDLDCDADTPVNITVNGHLIARGEIVVIDTSFGVRITEIIHSAVSDILG